MSLWSISRSLLVRNVCSTSLGKSSEAGARDAWQDRGTPSGRMTEASVTAMSTFSKSETGPSSSRFHRAVSASTNLA
eukprot:4711025-Pleurochrysis_carterae.AAC.1